MAFLAILVAILSPFWLFLFTFLAWPVVVPVALVAIGVVLFALIRSRTRFQRVAFAVALAVLTLFAGLFAAAWVSMFQHDRLMSELRDSACAVKPPGSEVVSCRSAGIENPFNGNQCGYSVEVLLRTSSSPLELEHFYASAGFHDAVLKNGLFLAEPAVFSVASGPDQLERVRLLFVGDEGTDTRCM